MPAVRFLISVVVLTLPGGLLAAVSDAVAARYGSKLEWNSLPLQAAPPERYWRTKLEWAESLNDGGALAGLRIALDPGTWEVRGPRRSIISGCLSRTFGRVRVNWS